MAQHLSRAQAARLQRDMNHFVQKYLLHVQPIRVDGVLGPSSRSRIKNCKYFLGYARPINSSARRDFRHRIRHPNSIRWSEAERIRRGMARRIKQRRDARKRRQTNRNASGVANYHGVMVAAVAVPILDWCKAHGWRGWVVSGYRDPNYSQSLCYRMCGRPSCPGKCAGLSSNHVGKTRQRFALDVSYYSDFGRIVARCPIQPRIHNSLGARDPVHFSPSGN